MPIIFGMPVQRRDLLTACRHLCCNWTSVCPFLRFPCSIYWVPISQTDGHNPFLQMTWLLHDDLCIYSIKSSFQSLHAFFEYHSSSNFWWFIVLVFWVWLLGVAISHEFRRLLEEISLWLVSRTAWWWLFKASDAASSVLTVEQSRKAHFSSARFCGNCFHRRSTASSDHREYSRLTRCPFSVCIFGMTALLKESHIFINNKSLTR